MRLILLALTLVAAAPLAAQSAFRPVDPSDDGVSRSCVEWAGGDDGLGFVVRAQGVVFHADSIEGECPSLVFRAPVLRTPSGVVWSAREGRLDGSTLRFIGLSGPDAPDEWIVDERVWGAHSVEAAAAGLSDAALGVRSTEEPVARVAGLVPMRRHALALAAEGSSVGGGGGVALLGPDGERLRLDGGQYDGEGTYYVRGAWHHREGPVLIALDADRALGGGRERFAGTPLRALRAPERTRLTLGVREGGVGASLRLERVGDAAGGDVLTRADLDVGARVRRDELRVSWQSAAHVGELERGAVRTALAAEWEARADVVRGAGVLAPGVRLSWTTDDRPSGQETRIRAAAELEAGWRQRQTRALLYGELAGSPFAGGARPGDLRADGLWRRDEGTAAASVLLGSGRRWGRGYMDVRGVVRAAERDIEGGRDKVLSYAAHASAGAQAWQVQAATGASAAERPAYARLQLGGGTFAAGAHVGVRVARDADERAPASHGRTPLRRADEGVLSGDMVHGGLCAAHGRVRLRGDVAAAPSSVPDIAGWGVIGVHLGANAGWLRVDAGSTLDNDVSAFLAWESGLAPALPAAEGRTVPRSGCR